MADPTLSDLEADQGVLRTIMATKVVQLHDSTVSDFKNWIGPSIVAETRLLDNMTVASRLGGDGTWRSSAREFKSFHTFMFQLRHKNMMRVAYSYRKKITRKNQRSNTNSIDENSNTSAQHGYEALHLVLS